MRNLEIRRERVEDAKLQMFIIIWRMNYIGHMIRHQLMQNQIPDDKVDNMT